MKTEQEIRDKMAYWDTRPSINDSFDGGSYYALKWVLEEYNYEED